MSQLLVVFLTCFKGSLTTPPSTNQLRLPLDKGDLGMLAQRKC